MMNIGALSEFEVFMLTIIGEARGEPLEGQVAVGFVVYNRVLARRSNFRDVCLAPNQFSCWNDNDPNRTFLESLGEKLLDGQKLKDYSQEEWVAHGIYDHWIWDPIKGFQYYMTNSLFNSDKRPMWARVPATDPIVIGNHTFFMVHNA